MFFFYTLVMSASEIDAAGVEWPEETSEKEERC